MRNARQHNKKTQTRIRHSPVGPERSVGRTSGKGVQERNPFYSSESPLLSCKRGTVFKNSKFSLKTFETQSLVPSSGYIHM